MNDTVASTLARELEIPHLVARLLVSRGIRTASAANRILDDGCGAELSHWLMKGMEDAVSWILAVREKKGKVFIFGDYDLDGMTSVTLLSRCFAQIGIESEWRLPNRFGDGYGLSIAAVEEMYNAGARNLVTVDTGITANVEIARAKELGMSVMVIDHHQPSGDALPPCDVLRVPHQQGDIYPNPELCGVGVSYKFICALFERLGMESPRNLLELVALGTLADLVQMTPENRFFTKTGLARLQNSQLPGVQALYSSLMKPGSAVGGIDVMYKIAPLLNTPGRMEKPDPALKLLMCTDVANAPDLMAELKEWNAQRKAKEAEITDMALTRVKEIYGGKIPKVLVVDGAGWHVGV
ncbi:MAG: DHH family phosphoesterase, partial [Fibrobacter sp.]|nr:DHH family phosphoesterase [Fibrobacter sp.]